MNPLLTWLCTVLLTFLGHSTGIDSSALLAARHKKALTTISCSPNWDQINIAALSNLIGPLPGSGNWQWKISTNQDSAQFYFNQGINLYYGFHIIESVPSFRKAQQFDPNCAILYWGEALALGPNINDLGYTASAEASKAAANALRLEKTASLKEKQLIQAMKGRYSLDSSADQGLLNKQYAENMRKAYSLFDKDPDIASLLADALMLLHPWDFWLHNGQPQTWTPEIVTLLEKVLKNSPRHPGANHYYIHVVEASEHPEKAKPSADRLGDLAPSLSHLVHMPSHIYVRTGEFEKGIKVNTAAVQGYEMYKTLFPAVVDKIDLYEIHNRHMQVACAINLDDYASALSLATDCRKSIPEDWLSFPGAMGYYIQYINISTEFVKAAFGHWDEILQSKEIDSKYVYADILQSFVKGLAYAHNKKVEEATVQLKKIEKAMTDSSLNIEIKPINAPISGSKVAHSILQGAIAEAKGQTNQAIIYYNDAVKFEDAMVYNEPKDWLLPARRWLGEALLKNGEVEKAREVFETDLRKNPGTLFSKKGLDAINKMKPPK